MEEQLLDSRQVAQRLHISRSYVYYLINTGELACVRIRNSIRVRPRDLERIMRTPRLGRASPRERRPQAAISHPSPTRGKGKRGSPAG